VEVGKSLRFFLLTGRTVASVVAIHSEIIQLNPVCLFEIGQAGFCLCSLKGSTSPVMARAK